MPSVTQAVREYREDYILVHQIIISPSISFILFLIVVISPSNVLSASVCYNEKYFPAVFSLQETKNGIQAQLGGKYSDIKSERSPIIKWVDDIGWSSTEKVKCQFCMTNAHIQECGFDIPSLRKPGQSVYIDEKPSACVAHDKYIWFGINFYKGEGYSGTGGFGRYQLETKKLELHRPPELEDIPIHKVVHDGNHIWAATTRNYECNGHPPALGLIRYDWNKKSLFSYIDKKDGPCGFVIHDLLWRKGFLWVATDIGLSRWDSKNDKWIHYFPDTDNPKRVDTKTCSEIYLELLETLPKDERWFDEDRSYYQILYEILEKFRPEYVKDYKW